MNIVRLVGGVLLSLTQLSAVITAYFSFAIIVTEIMSRALPGYTLPDGFGDTQAVLLIYLLWDRFYGPYASLLHGVAKNLNKAHARKKADAYVI